MEITKAKATRIVLKKYPKAVLLQEDTMLNVPSASKYAWCLETLGLSMISEKYLPNDSEIEQFFDYSIIGEMNCWCELGYDQKAIIKALKEFISNAIEHAILIHDSQVPDTVTDQNIEKAER